MKRIISFLVFSLFLSLSAMASYQEDCTLKLQFGHLTQTLLASKYGDEHLIDLVIRGFQKKGYQVVNADDSSKYVLYLDANWEMHELLVNVRYIPPMFSTFLETNLVLGDLEAGGFYKVHSGSHVVGARRDVEIAREIYHLKDALKRMPSCSSLAFEKFGAGKVNYTQYPIIYDEAFLDILNIKIPDLEIKKPIVKFIRSLRKSPEDVRNTETLANFFASDEKTLSYALNTLISSDVRLSNASHELIMSEFNKQTSPKMKERMMMTLGCTGEFRKEGIPFIMSQLKSLSHREFVLAVIVLAKFSTIDEDTEKLILEAFKESPDATNVEAESNLRKVLKYRNYKDSMRMWCSYIW